MFRKSHAGSGTLSDGASSRFWHAHLLLVAAQLTGTGFVGLAALISTRLEPAQRGALYAVVAAATLAAVLGGLSMDTVLLLPASHRHRRTLCSALAASLLCSCAAGIVAAVFAGAPLVPVGLGALLLTSMQLLSAELYFQARRFLALVLRGFAGLLVCLAYVGLLINSADGASAWIVAWLLAYGITVVVGVVCLVTRPKSVEGVDDEAQPDAGAQGLFHTVTAVHTGVGAQMITARLDQVLLARHSYFTQLGQYSLAASAVEFAQAGAMVSLQSILSDARSRTYTRRALAATWIHVLVVGIAVLAVSIVALALVGHLSPSYAGSLDYVPCLGAASLLACTSKVGSALLVSAGRPHVPAFISVAAAVLATTFYAVLIPREGAYGAAVATLIAAAAHACLTGILSLRGAARRSVLV